MKTAIPHGYGVRALREQLLQRRDQLALEVKAHADAARLVATPEPGGDAATLVQARETDLAEASRDAAELQAIDAALARMEAGEYGFCADCGVPIPHDRLSANPHALCCIACADAREHAGARPQGMHA